MLRLRARREGVQRAVVARVRKVDERESPTCCTYSTSASSSSRAPVVRPACAEELPAAAARRGRRRRGRSPSLRPRHSAPLPPRRRQRWPQRWQRHPRRRRRRRRRRHRRGGPRPRFARLERACGALRGGSARFLPAALDERAAAGAASASLGPRAAFPPPWMNGGGGRAGCTARPSRRAALARPRRTRRPPSGVKVLVRLVVEVGPLDQVVLALDCIILDKMATGARHLRQLAGEPRLVRVPPDAVRERPREGWSSCRRGGVGAEGQGQGRAQEGRSRA